MRCLPACKPAPPLCCALQYNTGEAVTLWVNKVGPYNNPQETCELWRSRGSCRGRRCAAAEAPVPYTGLRVWQRGSLAEGLGWSGSSVAR